MDYQEAKTLVEGLKERFKDVYSPQDKALIKRLYETVLNKTFRETTCQRCYHDAVIELTLYFRKNMELPKKKAYEMKSGYVIKCPTFHDGAIYTKYNITDEIAEEYLSLFPDKKHYFARVPEKPLFNAPQGVQMGKQGNNTTGEKKPRKTKKAKK